MVRRSPHLHLGCLVGGAVALHLAVRGRRGNLDGEAVLRASRTGAHAYSPTAALVGAVTPRLSVSSPVKQTSRKWSF